MSAAAQSISELIATYLEAVNGTSEPDLSGVAPPISVDCQAARLSHGGSLVVETNGLKHIPPEGGLKRKRCQRIRPHQKPSRSDASHRVKLELGPTYLISGVSDAILFDIFMLSAEAAELAQTIENSGKTLQAVIISHAHPDHFMGWMPSLIVSRRSASSAR